MTREPVFDCVKHYKLVPPKVRESQIGMTKPRLSADKLTRAVHVADNTWLIERMIHGAWEEVAECTKIADRAYKVGDTVYRQIQHVLEGV